MMTTDMAKFIKMSGAEINLEKLRVIFTHEQLATFLWCEREACARIAEQFGWSGDCRHVAAAIRARRDKP